MKNSIKKGIDRSILTVSEIFKSKVEKKALILAPSWEGSIGDEAVIDSITTKLKEEGFYTTLIHFGHEKEWDYLKSIDSRYNIPRYFKTGGWKDHLKFIKLFQNYSHFYALGTDMMDGCYADWLTNGLLRIANHAAYSGLQTTIVGFSLNSWQRENVIENLGKMHHEVRYCLRDDVSRRRFKELLPARKSILTADMAFLLTPTILGNHMVEANNWVLQQKNEGNLILGVNINPQLFNDETKTQELISVVEGVIFKLKQEYKNLSIVLIPHDFRANNSDIKILKELKDKINKEYVYLISKPFLASDMKGLVVNIDVVVTARMHLSIACLGQGTPIGCMVYQGKFDGLFNHFELDKTYLLNPEKALKSQDLFDFFKLVIENKEELKAQIELKLPDVKHKSYLNL